MKRLFLVAMDEDALLGFDRWQKRGSATNAVTALMGPLTQALESGDFVEMNYETVEHLEKRSDEVGKYAKDALGGRRERIRMMQLKCGINVERIQLRALDEFFARLFGG